MIVNILLLLTNILNIILEFFNKSLSIMLWGILLIIFTIPHLMIYGSGKVDIDVLNYAGTFVVVFNILYLITRIVINGGISLNYEEKLIDDIKTLEDRKEYINVCIILYIISFLIFCYGIISSGYSIFKFTWTDGISHQRGFIEKIAIFLISALSGIGLATFLRKERYKFILITVVYFSYVLITRSRYNIIPFIIPFLIHLIYSGEIKKTMRSVILGVVIIFSVFLLQQIRYAGSLSDLIKNYTISQIFENTFSFIKEGRGEFGLSKAFYYFVEKNNNFSKFGEGRTYIRLMLLPFPSSIFPFKCRDFAKEMWEAWNGMATTIGTMHPTLYGDAYANLGFSGVFLAVFYAAFTKLNDCIINKADSELKKILYIGIISTMYVLLARGAVYNSIANAFWSIILLNLVMLSIRLSIKLINKF